MHRHQLFSLATLFAVTIAAPGCADRTMEPEQVDPRVLYDFESCDDLLSYAKSNAQDMVEEYGSPWGQVDFDNGGGDPVGDTGSQPENGSGDGGEEGGGDIPVDHSETNVQEAGVDEPDLIKTDGERILALAQGQLHFVDASGATPTLRGSLALDEGGYDGYGAQLFLHEDRAMVLMPTYLRGGEDVYPNEGEPGDPEMPAPLPKDPPAKGTDLSEHFPAGTGSLLRLIEVDITDPDNLRIVSNLYISGDMVNARLIDGVARVVVRSSPTSLEFKDAYEFMDWDAIEPEEPWEPESGSGMGSSGEPGTSDSPGTLTSSASSASSASDSQGEMDDPPPPMPGTSGGSGAAPPASGDGVSFREGEPVSSYEAEWKKAQEAAKLYNLAVIESSGVDDWLPHFVLEDLSQGTSQLTKGRLLDCVDVRHPGEYSGLSMLSVLTVDLGKALALGKGVGVFSDGETVYASKSNLYVTTTPWRPDQWTLEDAQTGLTSYVHKFSLASATQAEYVASGAVRGQIKSQWSLSEWQGDLRLATTDQQSWDSATSESFVSVLRQSGDELQQIGQVGGLGKGEAIQGVRFIAGVGYVVTFRQTDPLYTIDLHDPAMPLAVGELKIPGYSAYLHPVGEDLLLGVGYDGTEEGNLLGLQLSLFDVADLKAPKRLHTAALGEAFGWSEAIFDPKAFLYWGKSKLAMLPMESYSWDEENMMDNSFVGAIGYTVDAATGFEPVGEIQHPMVPAQDPYSYDHRSQIRRSLVIGDRVLTLSDAGLKASLLGDFSDVAWIEF